MTKLEYLVAIDEVNQIIELLPEDEKEEIPSKFRDFLKSEWQKGYGIKIENNTKLKEQNLSEYTKALLSFICDKYLK